MGVPSELHSRMVLEVLRENWEHFNPSSWNSKMIAVRSFISWPGRSS